MKTPNPQTVAAIAAGRKAVEGEHASFAGRFNLYTCTTCRKQTITRDLAAGVTPFLIDCLATKHCFGRMRSSVYRAADQHMAEDFQWVVPTPFDKLSAWEVHHVSQGGLVLRPARRVRAGRVERLLSRVFGAPEEINGANRCDTYLYRWIVGGTRNAKAYLHKFVGDDWSRDFHDHPKRFISIGLWGSYLEETPDGFRRYSAPWVRSFPAHHQHRLTTPWGVCWTLVIVLKTVREWGFWNEGRFIPWETYVRGREGDLADRRKSCP